MLLNILKNCPNEFESKKSELKLKLYKFLEISIFWQVLFLACIIFGLYYFWRVLFLACTIFGMYYFWHVLFLAFLQNVPFIVHAKINTTKVVIEHEILIT